MKSESQSTSKDLGTIKTATFKRKKKPKKSLNKNTPLDVLNANTGDIAKESSSSNMAASVQNMQPSTSSVTNGVAASQEFDVSKLK